ncbi:MAG: Trk family potassium uptake protein [Chloroflexota bacterium]|nr:Trk family potassium uptake protein [Chloroflexota bacterium]
MPPEPRRHHGAPRPLGAGDRVVRVPRRVTASLRVESTLTRRGPFRPGLILIVAFASLIFLGTALLALPLSLADGQEPDLLVALFTATSAVCVTGLTVVSTHDHWSMFGQIVILALIQAGALGFIVGAIVIFSLAGRRTSTRERLMFGQHIGRGEPGGLKGLFWRIAIFTLILQGAGAVLLFLRVRDDASVESPHWWSIFHAVSAFTNAGFDIEPGSESFARLVNDPTTVGILAALAIIGAVGFMVIFDVLRRRLWRRLGLESRIVLTAMPALLVVGFVLLLVLSPNFGGSVPADDFGLRSNAALNHAVWRTTGFSTIDMGRLHTDTLIVLIVLMFIGGASAAVTGGITVNTFSVLFIAMVSHIRGRRFPEAFGRRIAQHSVMRALAVVGLSGVAVLLATVLMSIAERGSETVLSNLLFEAVSAFAVVGYSTGITADLTVASKLVLIGTMFVGRLGALTLAQALVTREHQPAVRYPEEAIKVG